MKSHFKFSRKQRNGIFLLLILILIFQCVYFFGVPIAIGIPSEDISINQNEWESFQKEVDSLALVELEKRKPKIYPFNPNYITDYRGYALGMSSEAIDRLHQFRAQDKWVNSVKEFQNVTKVSDSLLNTMTPYFKFPEWVTKQKYKKGFNGIDTDKFEKSYDAKIDLNTASASELRRINGIGEKLSTRIIKFRNSFDGGFIADIQLQDVYGLKPEVLERLTNEFTVKTPRQIIKLNLNAATVEDLVTIQHIDYELAYEIVEQRILREGFASIEELTKVKDFPTHKIEIIQLYLKLN